MKLADFFRDGEDAPQTQQIIKSRLTETLRLIAVRSQISNWVIFALFLVTLWATPIYRKFSSVTVLYGLALFFICFTIYIITDRMRCFKNERFWASLFLGLTLLFSLLWGLLSAWAIYRFNLSWTSFFITLITLAIASSYSIIYSSNLKLFQGVLLFTVAPSVIVNTMVLKGQAGDAIGVFLFGFTGLLSLVGMKSNRRYWELIISMERMGGLIQAIPGTLCWIDSEYRFLGSNKKFLELLPVTGGIKQHGIDADHPLRPLAEDVFKNTAKVSTSLQLGKNTFYFSGQKYNNQCEAVIIGMDITEQHMWQEVVEKERTIAIAEGRLAEMGRLLPVFAAYMDAQIEDDHSTKILHYLCADDEDNQQLPIPEIFNFIDKLYCHFIARKKLKLVFEASDQSEDLFAIKPLFISLCILIQNSIEAAGETPDHEIKVSYKGQKKLHSIVVTDNGSGIPREYEDVLFEPQISTKSNRMGIGLSLARDLIEGLGGSISLTSARKPTQFTLSIPKE